ncbi:MAG: SDR family NAD(P)-dependent oxidoreductase [Cyclobacteriaceae bacterium]
MSTYEKLNHKVVVIAGASAGVGRATAREFAKYNMKIALLARGKKGLEAAAREVEAAGSEAMVLPLDLADHDAVEQAAQKVQDAWNIIDIWVNNA